jgi:hypothetical protein
MPSNVWKLESGYRGKHPTITESTTSVVACGDSWCDGSCGLPALVLEYRGKELKAYGCMVAIGSVFQTWRVVWKGEKVPCTLKDLSAEQAVKRFWW